MKDCNSCKYSYQIGEWADYRGCHIVDINNNTPLKPLGEEGRCRYYSEERINGGWGAK